MKKLLFMALLISSSAVYALPYDVYRYEACKITAGGVDYYPVIKKSDSQSQLKLNEFRVIASNYWFNVKTDTDQAIAVSCRALAVNEIVKPKIIIKQ